MNFQYSIQRSNINSIFESLQKVTDCIVGFFEKHETIAAIASACCVQLSVCVHIEEVRLGDVAAAEAAAAEVAAVVPKAKKNTPAEEEVAVPKKNKICDSFPEELMDLYRHSKRLERKGQKDKFTEEMKNARRLVHKMYLTLQKQEEAAAAKPDMSLANAPVFVAPCSEPKQTALHDLAAQYASDSEDDEIFNTNWRPTPAPRRL